MDLNRRELIAHVLESSPSLPPSRRMRVLRGLAEVIGKTEEANELNALTAELEAAERRLQEFAFNLNHKP